MAESAKRGAYAKGVAKREEILTAALEIIAQVGVQETSIKAIADAVDLSPAGVLHYFRSKEELLTEVLRKRDEVNTQHGLPSLDLQHLGSPEGYAQVVAADLNLASIREHFVQHLHANSNVPGLLHLFSQLAVDAIDPAHPAHDFLRNRGEQFRQFFSHIFTHTYQNQPSPVVDPAIAARMLQALADGLQLHALVDPDVDMAGVVDAFFSLLTPTHQEQ